MTNQPMIKGLSFKNAGEVQFAYNLLDIEHRSVIFYGLTDQDPPGPYFEQENPSQEKPFVNLFSLAKAVRAKYGSTNAFVIQLEKNWEDYQTGRSSAATNTSQTTPVDQKDDDEGEKTAVPISASMPASPRVSNGKPPVEPQPAVKPTVEVREIPEGDTPPPPGGPTVINISDNNGKQKQKPKGPARRRFSLWQQWAIFGCLVFFAVSCGCCVISGLVFRGALTYETPGLRNSVRTAPATLAPTATESIIVIPTVGTTETPAPTATVRTLLPIEQTEFSKTLPPSTPTG